MVTSIEAEFIAKFHSLGGITIGERRKNLFLLLNETKQSLKAASGTIDVSSLQPKTPLEENFKIETMLYFRNIPELLQVLKSGNPILIEKILNVKLWFIEEAFERVGGEELTKQIFPELSYNTKLKLIHKMCLYLKNTQKVDEYFEAIKETYGAYLASKLLPACSANVIMKCIEDNRVEITPRQLLTIIKKYPALTETVLEKLHQFNYKIPVSRKYKMVFRYLAQHNVSLFLTLSEKYQPNIYLGARATDTMICREKENILKTPKRYYELLKTKRIGRNLKEDFSKVYLKLFPKSLKELYSRWKFFLTLLKFLPSDAERLKMLLMTFKAKHGSELWDHPAFITSNLIKMMSPDEREVWMQVHPRPKEISEDEWISFMKTEKAVPLLKERISITSKIIERAKLAGLLIATCNINKDSLGFLNVCKYLMENHRNDSSLVRQEIIRVMYGSTICLKLQNDHWMYINDFITLWKMKEQNYWTVTLVEKKYIRYCFENNLPVKKLLMEWTKSYKTYNILPEKPEYQKKCLLIFKEMFPSAYKKGELEQRYIQYLNALYGWNRRHPKDKFSFFIKSEAIYYLISYLQKNIYAYTEERIAAACVFSEYEKSKEFNLLEVLLKRNYHGGRIMTWLIKKRPLFLRDNINLMLKHAFKIHYFNNFQGNLCRYYTHLEIPQKLSDYCLEALNDKSYRTVSEAASVLAHLMNPRKFLNLSALHPTIWKVDLKSEEGWKTYLKQFALLPYLRHIIPPSLALDTALNFCRGDYLKSVQYALHSLVHNVSENKLSLCFDVLSERAVSVRKHGIFLGFKVLDKAGTYKILTKFRQTEKNASIHKTLFIAIFSYFVRNPDDSSWALAKQSVKSVNISDKEAFNVLTKCRRISSPYFVRYVLFTWGVLEELQNTVEAIEEGKCRILESITPENISKLPKQFCEEIIEKYFLKSNKLSGIQLQINSFACKYIIYHTHGLEHKQSMILIFASLQNYVKSTWYDPNTSVVGRKTVSNFVRTFCSNFIEKKSLNKDTLDAFTSSWYDCLKPYEVLDDYLHLQFTLIYVTCVNEKLTMSQIGENLAKLCDSLNDGGLLVLNAFVNYLSVFPIKFASINEADNADENGMLIIEGILETSKSPLCLGLAISLLPEEILMAPKVKQKYDKIMDVVMKESHSTVQMYLHRYLKDSEV